MTEPQMDGPTLVLRHDRAEMERLSAWLDGRLGALSLSENAAYAVRLCLEEAVMNVMMHATPQQPDAPVTVMLDRMDDGLIAVVEDGGEAFDPTAPRTARVEAETLEEVPIGGLGISLMHGFARSLHYRRDGAWNRLTLRFDG